MAKITLNDLLKTKVSKIYSGSELIFLYELSKYCKEILNKDLVFPNITIVKELKKSVFCQYLYAKGFNLDFEMTSDDIGDLTDITRKFFNSDLSGIVFEKKDDDEWIYCYETDRDKNIILNRYNRSAGYVSLYAYMLVLSYKNKKKVPKLILRNSSMKQEEFEYVDVLILKYFGNKFLEDKVETIFSKDVVTQPEWEAYVVYHRQLGFMQKEYTAAEKFKYISKKFEVGDVVLYYKTDKAIKSKTIRRLESCHPAVITSIDKNNIKLVYYPDVTTLLTRRRLLERAEEACGGKYKYSDSDFDRFAACTLTLDYFNIGVDLMLYQEDVFLFTPKNGVDKFEQFIVDKNGVEGSYWLDTLNTIYAVFEDRDISYNKKKFLDTYFKKTKPVYMQLKGE